MKKYKPVIKKVEVNDEHYYLVKEGKEFIHYPSVTKILHEAMPTPFALRKWIGDVGNEKAQKKLEAAGERGSAIHGACEQLLLGMKVELHKNFTDKKDQKCIVSFIDWVNEFNPIIKKPSHIEFTVASTQRYAGTLDIFCYINEEPYIVDIKTSGGIYDEHFLQITAYQEAFFEMTGIKAKRAILHLNYRTKKGYRFYDDKDFKIKKKPVVLGDFITVYNMYVMLNRGIPEPPKHIVYPEVVKLLSDK